MIVEECFRIKQLQVGRRCTCAECQSAYSVALNMLLATCIDCCGSLLIEAGKLACALASRSDDPPDCKVPLLAQELDEGLLDPYLVEKAYISARNKEFIPAPCPRPDKGRKKRGSRR